MRGTLWIVAVFDSSDTPGLLGVLPDMANKGGRWRCFVVCLLICSRAGHRRLIGCCQNCTLVMKEQSTSLKCTYILYLSTEKYTNNPLLMK